MSIRARIMALMACFALMALAVTALGLATITDYNHMMKAYGHAYENVWRGERMNHLVSNVVMDSRGVYIARNAEERDTFATNLRNNLDDVEGLMAQWRASSTPQELQRLQPILTEAQEFVLVRRDVIRLAFSNQQSAAEKRGVDSRPARIAFQNHVETLVNTMHNELVVAQTKADAYSHQRAGEFLFAALLGIVLMMSLSLWIVAHFITRPLQDVASAIIKTSKGDYDLTLSEHEGQDEVSSVWQALAVLKSRAIEAERLAAAQREAEHQQEMKLREIMLD